MPTNPRVRSNDSRRSQILTYRPFVNGTWDSWVNYGNCLLGETSSVTDTIHPWPPKRGNYIGGDFVRTKRKETATEMAFIAGPVVSLSGLWEPQEYVGPWSLACNFDRGSIPLWLADDRNSMVPLVTNRAFSKAYSSKATLLVTVGELHKSISMVRKPFAQARTLLAQMTRRYRNLLFRGLKAADAAAKAWLEYRMGWKPLLYDLSNIAKAVHKTLSEIDQTYDESFRSKITQNWGDSGGGGTLSPSAFAGSSIVWRRSVKASVSAGVIVRFNMFDEASKPWQAMFGVELHDVAPSLWELMPYSFVVDRFLEVQTWLEAIQPRPNTRVMFSWVTTVYNHVYDADISLKYYLSDGTPVPLTQTAASEHETHFAMNRTCGVSPSIVPALNVQGLNLKQHADHAALIVGLLKGLFPEVTTRNFGDTREKSFVRTTGRKL